MLLDLSQPRTLGGLLRGCLRIYANYFWTFALIAYGVVVPVETIVLGLGAGQLTGSYDPNPPLAESLVDSAAHLLVIVPLITAMHVLAVADVGAGLKPSAAKAMRGALRIFLPLVAVLAIYTVTMVAGIFALIVPGIFVYVVWYFAPQVLVVERKAIPGSLSRSYHLVKDCWWRVFGLLLAFTLIAQFPLLAISLPLDRFAEATDSAVWHLVGRMLTDAPLLSFTALSGTLLYFDLRARHEIRAAGGQQLRLPTN